MEFVLGGEVDLVKERQEEMQLFGAIEATSGYARPLGKNFELDDAVVTFYGPIENPELNIHTLYEPPQAAGVRIYYIDRKSTRLNSSHVASSYAVFCLQ